MQLRYDVQLRAMIKSLSDVVLPAVDEHNQLAREQIQVTIGMLSLMAERLPLQFRYDCDELQRLIEFAATLSAQAVAPADDHERAALRSVADDAKSILAGAQAGPNKVLGAIRRLRAASAAVVTASYRDGTPEQRKALTQVVTAHAEAQLLRERAWVLPQGWEADPAGVTAIEELL